MSPHDGAGRCAPDAAPLPPPGPGGFSALTAREHEVFELVVAGTSNKQIANRWGISIKTVETHRGAINRKLGAHSTADLVRIRLREVEAALREVRALLSRIDPPSSKEPTSEGST